MRSLGIVILLSVVCWAELSPDPATQAEAISKYPQLGEVGSRFNKLFVSKVQAARKQGSALLNDPRWPLIFADDVASELGVKPVEKRVEGHGGGLLKMVRMTVEEVAANPFSLEGSLIELTGIGSCKAQEFEKGQYEVTIRGVDYSILIGKLPQQTAVMAETSKKLFVTVTKAKKLGTEVAILGNNSFYSGLSLVPKVNWSNR